jgi:hypothetical protein
VRNRVSIYVRCKSSNPTATILTQSLQTLPARFSTITPCFCFFNYAIGAQLSNFRRHGTLLAGGLCDIGVWGFCSATSFKLKRRRRDIDMVLPYPAGEPSLSLSYHSIQDYTIPGSWPRS